MSVPNEHSLVTPPLPARTHYQFNRNCECFVLQLEKFILLGHSFGGYLASAYAMRYPERLHHLVLADPWGFPEKPPDSERNNNLPIWIKVVAKAISPFNPLAGLRAAGPWGEVISSSAKKLFANTHLHAVVSRWHFLRSFLPLCR